jgi:hypothetical protein
MKDESTARTEISLSDFIGDNDKLLSALAAFVALIAFTQGFRPEFVAGFLSFVLIAGIVLIGIEIWRRLPDDRLMSWRLFLFRYVLYWSLAGVIFYWLLNYRVFWDVFLYWPVMILVLVFEISTVVPAVKRFEVTRRFFGVGARKNGWQKTMLVSGWTIAIFTSILYGTMFAFSANVVLDFIKQLTH